MNAIAIRNIAWKEVRQMMTLLIGLAILAAAVQVIGQIAAVRPNVIQSDQMNLISMFGLVGLFSAVFAAACGALMFSAEREQKTVKFLELLPVTPISVMLGKVLGAFVLITAFWFVTVLVIAAGFLLSNQQQSQTYHFLNVIFSVALASAEFFCWGWFCSLFTQRVLPAITASIILASFSVNLLAWSFYTGGGVFDALDLNAYNDVVPYRLVLLTLLVGVNIRYSQGWLGRRGSGTLSAVDRLVSSARIQTAKQRQRRFLNLCWQAAHQNRLGLTVYVATMLFAASSFSWMALYGNPMLRGLILVLILIAPWFCGVLGFNQDQIGRRYRYFAVQGEYPLSIGLSRIVVCLGTVLAMSAIAVTFVEMSIAQYSVSQVFETRLNISGVEMYIHQSVGWLYVLYSIGACAIGLWCSLLIRSSIVAGVVSLILIAIYTAWILLAAVMLLPMWCFILPIPLVFVVSLLTRIRHWIVDRDDWRSLIVPVVVIVVPLAALFFGMTRYRVTEIPLVEFDLDQETNADVKALQSFADDVSRVARSFEHFDEMDHSILRFTRDMSRFPLKQDDPDTREEIARQLTMFVDANAELFDQVNAIVDNYRQPGESTMAIPLGTRGDRTLLTDSHRVKLALHVNSLHKLFVKQDVDEAFDAILVEIEFALHCFSRGWLYSFHDMHGIKLNHWLHLPEQSAGSLQRAEQRLRPIFDRCLDAIPLIIEDRYQALKAIESTRISHARSFSVFSVYDHLTTFAINYLPWEKARYRRLIDAQTETLLAHERYWKDVKSEPTIKFSRHPTMPSSRLTKQKLDEWAFSTPFYQSSFNVEREFQIESHRAIRATWCSLYLVRHRFEVGHYPETLDELVNWLKRQGIEGSDFIYDPQFRTNSFQLAYFPHGQRNGIVKTINTDDDQPLTVTIVEKNVPFLIGQATLRYSTTQEPEPTAGMSGNVTIQFRNAMVVLPLPEVQPELLD